MLILIVNLTLVKSGEEYQDGYIIMVKVKIRGALLMLNKNQDKGTRIMC